MIAKTNTQYYQDIADSIRYSKDNIQYESDLTQEKNKIKQINEDIAAVYNECEAKGAIMPEIENSTNLAQTVASIPEAVSPILITKQITENGVYNASEDNADGYSNVTINVPDQSIDALNSLIGRSITTITSGATSIGDYAFYIYTALTEVNFPEATSIGQHAFHNCAALTEANFQKATSIGDYAFNNCAALTEANFQKATSIGDYAFSNCKFLTEVNFPEVTSIGSSAFFNCKSIKYFDMSEVAGVPTIGSNTFKNTTCIFLFRDQTQLNEYASATNWSTLANRFRIKG